MDWRTATNDDALRAWDAGGLIWSCSMGGMGPGYEQCIQIMGMEMLRAMIAAPPEKGWPSIQGEAGREAWRKYTDQIGAVPTVHAVVEKMCPSGAQHGAAMNIASVFAVNGYAKGMEMVPKERRIQVKKDFPTLTGAI